MRLNHLVYGLWLVGAAAATFSCGGDDTAPGSGGTSGKGSTAGSSGSSGSSAGGKSAGGENHAGGAPSGDGGAGGAGTAAVPAGGADQGMGGDGGGQAGEAPVSKCGNGVVDPGEACDPAAASANGCSAKCTLVACDACMEVIHPPTNPLAGGPPDCSSLPGDAAGRCQAVLDCAATSHCAAVDKVRPPHWDAALPCLCGPGLDYEACAKVESTAELLGVCKDQMVAASDALAGERTPAIVIAQINQTQSDAQPIGVATNILDDPGPLQLDGCDAVTLSSADRTQCKAVLECLHMTHCAKNEGDAPGAACYCGDWSSDACLTSADANDARLNGACKDVMQQAAGGSAIIPLQVAQIFYDLSTPLGAAVQWAVEEDANCQSQCYAGGAP